VDAPPAIESSQIERSAESILSLVGERSGDEGNLRPAERKFGGAGGGAAT